MNRQKLAGKVAFVTGASKGIGAHIAKHLAAEGAVGVVNYASSKMAQIFRQRVDYRRNLACRRGSMITKFQVERFGSSRFASTYFSFN
jgi:NAD(P)-dependent dehydrogenase (short-subunit alcohol dehydrogenase family)